jgi:hypothetical protein
MARAMVETQDVEEAVKSARHVRGGRRPSRTVEVG